MVERRAIGIRQAVMTAILTLFVQALLYAVTVRDDIRDLKRDVLEVRCEVAVGFRRSTLPNGCTINTAAKDGTVVQTGVTVP